MPTRLNRLSVAFRISVFLFTICSSLIVTDLRAQSPASLTATTTSKADWPWWRGPHADGTSAAQTIPTTWSKDENVLWKTDLPGNGYSSPIVINGKIFLTSAEDKGEIQSLHCISLDGGQLHWSTLLHQGQFPKKHRDNSQASATPASDGKYVFTSFGNKDGVWLSAVDMNGKVVWSKNTGPYPSEHGYSASVCHSGNLVYIAGEAVNTGFIGAFDCKTGDEVWRAPRTPDRDHANYASPVVVDLAGRKQLIIGGWHLVTSYDPETGTIIWENPGPADVNANSIAIQNPYLIVSGGFPQKKIICIKADEPDGANGRKVVWDSIKNVAWVPSPLIHDNRLLIMSDKGVLSEMDLKTGEFFWFERFDKSAYASPIRVGDIFIATTRDGAATVFKSSDKFEFIAKNNLDDGGGNATPTAVDNKLLIRTDHSLFCIGTK